MALIGEFVIGDRKLFVYNVHLESHASDAQKALQMQDVLEDIDSRTIRDDAVIVLGDMNTDLGENSPIVEVIRDKGFEDALAGFEDIDAPTSCDKKKIDWIFAKNLKAVNGSVYSDGFVASDHRPVVAELEFVK